MTENSHSNADTSKVTDILDGARKTSTNPDAEIAQMLSSLAGQDCPEAYEAALERLIHDANPD